MLNGLRKYALDKMIFCLMPWVFLQKIPAQPMAVGGRHSLLICNDQRVAAFGYNGFGQLGIGNLKEQHTPTTVLQVNQVTHVAGGLFHSLFVKNDGTVWSVGRNATGALGDGSYADRTIPTQVMGLFEVQQVSGGSEHSLFLKKDGTVWACGLNSSGQLGDGSTTSKNVAVKIEGLDSVVRVEAGAEYSLFLKENGSVWACGYNGFGQLGLGSRVAKTRPVPIPGMTEVVDVSAGEWHSLFVKKDGSVWACGRNQSGQLGISTLMDQNTPVQINGLPFILQVSAGGIHSAFVSSDGEVWTCGLNSGGNNDGQLGDGTNQDRLIPVRVHASWDKANIIQAACTREHTLLLDDQGTLWACGRNNYGQLGIGSFTTRNFLIPEKSLLPCQLRIVSGNLPDSQYRELSYYPNPTQSTLHISSWPCFVHASIVLYNSMGYLVWTSSGISGCNSIIELPKIPDGVYYVSVMDQNGWMTRHQPIVVLTF